jgi:hypothetical protein
MALIKCPDCKADVSDKSDKCVHCGCPIKTKKEKRPEYSVGPCPACGSLDTYDLVQEERKKGGFFQAFGARMGLRIAGNGRFVCNKCKHSWEYGAHI